MSVWISRMMRRFSSGIVGMTQETSKSYEEAVRTLNTLQSNAAVLDKAKKEKNRDNRLILPQIIAFAERIGLKTRQENDEAKQFRDLVEMYRTSRFFALDDIDKLSLIHVSGTKGKGSTCAFCERILREHGYKTGFYSSPHLVEVRERIRINGRPLPKDAFNSYFWDCFSKLESTKEHHGGTMPSYFRFLTIMAFHVFLQEKVDVAIIEVGVGGLYDCTNVIRTPVVCGVSTLDLDHTDLLGDTIEKIAAQKAGIFKHGVPAVTVPQTPGSLEVMMDRAKEVGASLTLAPNFDDYTWPEQPVELGIPGDMQKLNASLAIQLTQTWLQDHGKSIEQRKAQYLEQGPRQTLCVAKDTVVPKLTAEGLGKCQWPGRGQIVNRPSVTYYLDGAHTPISIQNCVSWYKKAAKRELQSLRGRVIQVLLFNSTGDRKAKTLLAVIAGDCKFDLAVFCPNIATSKNSADQTNMMVTTQSQHARVQSNRQSWLELINNQYNACRSGSGDAACTDRDNRDEPDQASSSGDSQSSPTYGMETSLVSDMDCAPGKNTSDQSSAAYTFGSIEELLTWLSQGKDPMLPSVCPPLTPPAPLSLRSADHVQVLCTGSLHLIGGILGLIGPDTVD